MTKDSESGPPVEAGEDKYPGQLSIVKEEGRTTAEQYAAVELDPFVRHGVLARRVAASIFTREKASDLDRSVALMREIAEKVRAGSLEPLTDMLTVQAITLDVLATRLVLAGQARVEAGQSEPAKRYLDLALKAQARCQTTVESLAKIKRGGKQIVQVVHVHSGGQAVVADTVNNQRGMGNDRKARLEAERAGNAAVAALLCQNPEGDALSLPGDGGA